MTEEANTSEILYRLKRQIEQMMLERPSYDREILNALAVLTAVVKHHDGMIDVLIRE